MQRLESLLVLWEEQGVYIQEVAFFLFVIVLMVLKKCYLSVLKSYQMGLYKYFPCPTRLLHHCPTFQLYPPIPVVKRPKVYH